MLLAGCGGGAEDAARQEPESAAVTPEPATAAGESATQTAQATAKPPAAFMQCRSCHAVEPGRHGVGPSLFAVYGTKAGELPGYSFSAAMKDSGLTWDDATLDKWLEAPAKLVPGTKMIYAGMPDPAKRKDVIEYMKALK